MTAQTAMAGNDFAENDFAENDFMVLLSKVLNGLCHHRGWRRAIQAPTAHDIIEASLL
jgi:hypothetical protein